MAFFFTSMDLSQVQEIIRPIVKEEGLELLDVIWVAEQGRRILRVLLEKEDGSVSLEDCTRTSHAIEDILEVKQVISVPYDLEVSSAGINRPLKTLNHFHKVVGKNIRLQTKIPVDGRRNYKGALERIENSTIIMMIDGMEYSIPFPEILKANLEII